MDGEEGADPEVGSLSHVPVSGLSRAGQRPGRPVLRGTGRPGAHLSGQLHPLVEPQPSQM